jgi:2'-5' RNA ligase
MRTRIFVAVAATEGVYDTAVRTIKSLSRLTQSIKWVEPQNLHWTLHFLGELEDDEIYDVCRACEQTAAVVAPFSAYAGGVSTFGDESQPRTIWLGLVEGEELFAALHDDLRTRLDALGFRGDRRRFVPHLTLGRIARHIPSDELAAVEKRLSELSTLDAGSFGVDELTIYASRLRREGPDYQVYGSYELVGNAK